MALIRSSTPIGTHLPGRVHGEVECGYGTFEDRGRRFLQLDTYGSADRAIPGKVSQTFHLDEEGARELKKLLLESFPGL